MAHDDLTFMKELLDLLEKGAHGDVNTVKQRLRERIKLFEKQAAKAMPARSRVFAYSKRLGR